MSKPWMKFYLELYDYVHERDILQPKYRMRIPMAVYDLLTKIEWSDADVTDDNLKRNERCVRFSMKWPGNE